MVEEWQLVRLGDVATTSQGGTPRKNEADYWNGQIPFLTGADLTEFRLSRKHARSFLTTEGLHSGQTVVCEPGALLLATRTRVGLAGLTTEIMGASQDITRLTPSDEVHSGYLCRYLLSVAASLQRKSRGTTIQGITKDELQSIAIPLPPRPEQRAIANILDSIDHAIEATDALVSSTEQLRDSLLHKLLTRGLPGHHTEWKQVPGLGTIPADWEDVSLGDKVVGGPTNGIYKQESEYGRGVWIIRIDDFVSGSLVHTDSFQRIRVSEDEACRYIVRKGEILINRVNSLSHLGKSVLIPHLNEATLFESNMMKLRMCADVIPEFAANVLLSQSTRQYFMSRAKKAVQQASINQKDVSEMPFPLPPLPEQQAIAAILESVDESIDKGRGARERLRLLKESASDALLTGRVRVQLDTRNQYG